MRPLLLIAAVIVACGSSTPPNDAGADAAKDTGMIDCSKIGCAMNPGCGQICTAVCGCCGCPTGAMCGVCDAGAD